MLTFKQKISLFIQNPKWIQFVPKSITCLLNGYTRQDLGCDIFAGITIGIIALPLAMAFAMGSGVDPERGIATAIVAGFLVSLFGGSRFQIAGPTGAFVMLLSTIVQKSGYEGLATAALTASVLLILFGMLRLGVLLRFIPHPVLVGFSSGIAVVILITQVKDLCGLTITNPSPDAIDRIYQYIATFSTFHFWSFVIAALSLGIMIYLRRISKKIPAPIIALGVVTCISWIFSIPIETVFSKYGEIPTSLPTPHLPPFSFDLLRTTFPDALAIALLCAIESLLSCAIADGLSGTKHRSNCELIAEGIGNFGSILFGGIPACGAIARTATNVQMQAKSPISGMIHSATILLLIMVFAPFASLMPLPALAAVLAFIAWNMLEFHHIRNIFKGPRADRVVFASTCLITILVGITAAVQTGVFLSIIVFLKKMSDATTGTIVSLLNEEEKDITPETRVFQPLPKGVQVFEIEGPFFFAVSDLLNELYAQLKEKPTAIILRLKAVPLIDSSGIHAIERFTKRMKEDNILFFICEARGSVARTPLLQESQKSFDSVLQEISD